MAMTSLEGYRGKKRQKIKAHFKCLISVLGHNQGPLHLCLHTYVTKPF